MTRIWRYSYKRLYSVQGAWGFAIFVLWNFAHALHINFARVLVHWKTYLQEGTMTVVQACVNGELYSPHPLPQSGHERPAATPVLQGLFQDLFNTLQGKFHLCIPRKGIARPHCSVPFSTFMRLWAINMFPKSVHIFYCSRRGIGMIV